MTLPSIVPSERAVCLIGYDDQILVAKNKISLHWTLPGGILRQNEDFVQAIFRSVLEKTEIDLRKESLAYCGKSNDSKQDQILHVFHATLKEGQLHSPQETDLKWVAKGQLEIIDTNEGIAKLATKKDKKRGVCEKRLFAPFFIFFSR